MKFRVEKSFDRDVGKIKDIKLLRKVRDCIAQIENADKLAEILRIKKIEGYISFYRIKTGNYRLGIELSTDNEIILRRFLHRKEIYRYFPNKK